MCGENLKERLAIADRIAAACADPATHADLIAAARRMIPLYHLGGKDRGRGHAIMQAVIDGRGAEPVGARYLPTCTNFAGLVGYMTRRERERWLAAHGY